MTDYQQLVEEIRSFLQSTDMTLTDRLKELANAYAEACRTANQRLRRCEEFLGKGLRSEAIQFAQAEPALLDVVAALDFPERTALQETLTFYGLPDPPRLRLESAEALNLAYAEEQPLTDLLRKHRHLALLRAPLAARIKVMRQIAAADGNSPIWDEDLRSFETARIREIQSELAGAGRQNTTWIAGVAGELEQPGWLTPPPAALLRQVRERAEGIARDKARGTLEEVVGQLNGAMATADLPRAQELRERYLSLLDHAGLEPNDPLVRHASRPLNWLAQSEQLQAQELEFQNAVAAVEGALDDEADPEEVTRLYNEAQELGHAMPKRLNQRYEEYLAQKDHARRWRERLILITVAVTCLIAVLGVVAYLWLKSVRARSSAAPGPVGTVAAQTFDEATMADARFYIRVRGKILGPFDMAQLRRQRKRGQLSRFHEISEDRITWVPASSLVDLFPPDGSPPPSRNLDSAGITGVPPSGGGGDRGGAVWHYTNLLGKQVGPVTREQLLALLDEGTIEAQTLVWNPSLQEWAPLESVPGLLAGGAGAKKGGGLRFSLGLVSVAAAVVWFCGLGSAAAVVLGVMALREARQKRDAKGRKMALTGIIAGAGGLVLALVVFLSCAGYYAFHGPDNHTPDQIFAEYHNKVYRVEYSEGKTTIQGSGILLASDARRGLIATNLHVIAPDLVEEATGRLSRKLASENGLPRVLPVDVKNPSQLQSKKARVAAIHKELDLALLLIEADNARPEVISVVRQDRLRDGEAAVAMGYPLGLQLNTTPGIISNHHGDRGLVWTNCPISPGNSGGPLFLQRGGLLAGLNTGSFNKGQNINGAVPAEQIVNALHEGRTDNWVWDPELRDDVLRLAKSVPLSD